LSSNDSTALTVLDEAIKKAAEAIRAARQVMALTGAGVSKESGIPTFRDALTGLWANYDPEKLATAEGFLSDPPLVWQWYDERRKAVQNVKPNAGHFALAELEKLVPSLAVVTQNIDGLHAAAGTSRLIELHGNIKRIKCFDRGHQAESVPLGLPAPPKCYCGSLLRPDVVWFGEMLPEKVLNEAFKLAEESDVILVIGTSGLVQPAASLPLLTRRAGGTVIEINPEDTPITGIAQIVLRGASAQVLPKLVESLLRTV
jgi:NAD-dependent deacetylase